MSDVTNRPKKDSQYCFNKTHFLTIVAIIVAAIIAVIGGAYKLGQDIGSNAEKVQLLSDREEYTAKLDSVKTLWSFTEARFDTASALIVQFSEVMKKVRDEVSEPLRSEIVFLLEPQDFIKSIKGAGDGSVSYELKPDFSFAEIFVVFWARSVNTVRPNTVVRLDALRGKFRIPEETKKLPIQKWFNFLLKDESGRQHWGLVSKNSLEDEGNILEIDDFGGEGKAFRWYTGSIE